MNKQEILDDIKKTEEHLTNMIKMLEECESERWKPKEGEKYWYLTNSNQVSQIDYTSTRSYKYEDDYQRWSVYNCFQTRQQAEAEAEKILVRRILEDIARRLNKSKEIDWNNFAQDKYFLGIDYNKYLAMSVGLSCCNNIRTQGTVYCLNRNFKDVAIQEIGEERLKKYLRGK